MNIGILGAGTVARTLGIAWAAKGHNVCIGARDQAELAILTQEHKNLARGSLGEAARFGEVVLLAINPWTEIEAVLQPLAATLAGKIIVDVSNNITFSGKPALAFGDKSMGEYVQNLVPESYVVKTLNITPAPMMVNPRQSGIVPAIGWTAGNDTGAKQKVAELLRALGWDEVVDLGGIEKSRLQENVGLIFTLVVAGLRG